MGSARASRLAENAPLSGQSMSPDDIPVPALTPSQCTLPPEGGALQRENEQCVAVSCTVQPALSEGEGVPGDQVLPYDNRS
jgi:hypothetical protein